MDLLFVGGQCGVDVLVHVGAQTASEHRVRHGPLELHVLGVQILVCLRVNRVVRLVAALCEPWRSGLKFLNSIARVYGTSASEKFITGHPKWSSSS